MGSTEISKVRREGFDGQHLIVFPQEIQRSLATNPLTKSLYITHIGYFPKATNHMVHRRTSADQSILICCHNGEGWCQLAGENSTNLIQKGQMLVIPAGQAHYYGSRPGESWEVSWIHFSGDAGPDLCESLCKGRYGSGINIGDCSEALRLFSDIVSSLERGLNFETCSHASMRIWHFFSELLQRSSRPEPKTSNVVQRAIDLMHDHIEETLNLTELSDELGISSPYLCRIFKEQTGHSPMDYNTRLKVQRACKYLDLTNSAVKYIAERLGYEDPYYFSRMFKRIMQCSPTQYRENSRGQTSFSES